MRLYFKLLFCAALVLVLAAGIDSLARDTLVSVRDDNQRISDSARLIVRIERQEIVRREIDDTLLITLQAIDYPIAGFDLCFATNSPYLDIVKILPGEIIDSCKWEYFTARRINTSAKADYPTTMWKAIGLAEMIPDSSRPKCYGFDRKASLAKLVVSNSHVMQMPEAEIPIYFYWVDCTDNTISSETGAKLAMSTAVLDYIQPDIADTLDAFPTRKGAPTSCINPARANRPERVIEFHNGGIVFTYGAAADTSTAAPAVLNSPKVTPKTISPRKSKSK